MAVALLAAVPAIICGMWGVFVIVPVVAQYVQPAVIDTGGEMVAVGMAAPMFTAPREVRTQPYMTGQLN
jgi:phosphate transport system permease protein